MKVSDVIKWWLTVVTYIVLVTLFLSSIIWLSAALCGCSSQPLKAETVSGEEAQILMLKTKVANQDALIRAYENVLHEIWLDRPNYVEDALVESDAFCDLNDIMGETDVFILRNKQDSIRYNYSWRNER